MEVSKKDTVEIGSKTLVLWTKINLHINKILNTFVYTGGNSSLSKCSRDFVSRHTLKFITKKRKGAFVWEITIKLENTEIFRKSIWGTYLCTCNSLRFTSFAKYTETLPGRRCNQQWEVGKCTSKFSRLRRTCYRRLKNKFHLRVVKTIIANILQLFWRNFQETRCLKGHWMVKDTFSCKNMIMSYH